MVLQKGDFILIEYTAKVKETNEVFDTTNEETAKKEHLHKEGEIYEPKLIVTGAGRVLLDFNLPLAGKTLVYDVTVQKKLAAKEDKMTALIHRRIPIAEAAKFKLTIEENA